MLIFLACLWAHTEAYAAKSIAILGDSLSTGAGTHTQLQYQPQSFWKIFEAKESVQPQHLPILSSFDITASPEPARILWPTAREFTGAMEWIGQYLKRGFSMWYFNTPEYSWGYLVGRSLGYQPQNILIAAENGARIGSLTTQVERVLSTQQDVLPEKVFIFYTGNDLCATHPTLITPKVAFEDSLHDGLRYLTKNSQVAADGSDIYVIGMAPIQQIIAGESILDRPVKAYGLQTTCRQLRSKRYRPDGWLNSTHQLPGVALYFKDFIPPNPAAICPTLFGPPDEVSEHLSTISGRIRHYRIAAESAVKAAQVFSDQQQKDIRFHWVNATSQMQFSPEHIADDCFHLSLDGQAYLAQTILQGIK